MTPETLALNANLALYVHGRASAGVHHRKAIHIALTG